MAFEQLEIQISDNAGQAATGLAALTNTLERLKTATTNSAGLNKVAIALERTKMAASGINGLSLDTFGNQLTLLQNKLSSFNSTMGALGKNNLTSFVTQLGKIPELVGSLNALEDDGGFVSLATSIQKVADAMRPLAVEMEKISKGFSALPKRIQSFITQMDRSGRSATTAAKSYKSLGGQLSSLNAKFNVGILIAALRRLANVMGGFVENSNQYVEDMNLFTVSMGEYADAAYEYAMKAQELMGIDAGQFMRNQGFFQSIASGFGVASDKATVLSKNLAQLGYDLASFYNSDVDTAMQKLQSGLAGELEPLRRWGFALDQVTLQETARRHGIQMSIRDMNQAQKAQIRYIAIMEQSTNAQHDMARTLVTPANAMRIMNQQITLLGRSIGNILIPLLSAILPYAIAVAKALRMVADAIASLFGFSAPSIDYDAFGGLGVGASAAEDIEDAVGGAATNAKKLRDYMLGIDELNILKPDDDNNSGGSGIGGVGGGFDNLELPQYDFLDGLENRADEIVQKLQNMIRPFADAWNKTFSKINWGPLFNSIDHLKSSLGTFGNHIGDGLLWVWENILVPLSAWTISEVIPVFLEILAEAFDLLNVVISAIKPSIQYLWDNFLRPIAQWTGGIIVEVLNLIGETFKKVSAWFVENGGAINSVITGIGEILSSVWQIAIKPTLTIMWEVFKNTFGGIVDSALELLSGLTKILNGLIKFITGVFSGNWEKAWSGIKDIFGGVFESLKALVKAPINWIIDRLNGFFRGLNKIKMPDWVPGIGGKGFNIPEIPRLASGGIVNSGQLFIGRENGPELVGNFGSKTGVMNNDQIVGAVSAGVYEAMTAAMSVQGGDGQPIIIQLDGRTIYESNVRQDQSYGYAGFRQTAVNMG